MKSKNQNYKNITCIINTCTLQNKLSRINEVEACDGNPNYIDTLRCNVVEQRLWMCTMHTQHNVDQYNKTCS